MSEASGYRPQPAGGVKMRSDVVDVYVFRAVAGGADVRQPVVVESEQTGEGPQVAGVEFLQLLRVGAPLAGTWQPVMGHIEAGETAVEAAVREMDEELGLMPDAGLVALWALEQVHPFYIAEIDSIVMSPRLVAQVAVEWTPRLNDEHSDARWVAWPEVWRRFMWPGRSLPAARSSSTCFGPARWRARRCGSGTSPLGGERARQIPRRSPHAAAGTASIRATTKDCESSADQGAMTRGVSAEAPWRSHASSMGPGESVPMMSASGD